ncbi:unnamed protein product [Didymodactylos carnosus]|uniref:Uncharacterized protein n=1 Tax=Didymodactylos carnosus TaxID=1234261 RepID=A0A813Q369_9BILA|nr:unnamed protein product [Didymodactylos carnosus]CAF3542206.1 unnamed protein product [Didymodactylos carnosus]
MDESRALERAVKEGQFSSLKKIAIAGPHTDQFKKNIEKNLHVIFKNADNSNLRCLQEIDLSAYSPTDYTVNAISFSIEAKALPNLKVLNLYSLDITEPVQLRIIAAITNNSLSIDYLNVSNGTDSSKVALKLLNLDPFRTYSSNYLHEGILRMYKEIENLKSKGKNKEEIARHISKYLDHMGAQQNIEVVKYILERPVEFPIILSYTYLGSTNTLMKYYNNDLQMHRYLFSKGFTPVPISGQQTVLQQIANDAQSSHDKNIIKKRDWVLEQLVRIPNNEIQELIGNFSDEISEKLLLNNQILLETFINTSLDIRKEFFTEVIYKSSGATLKKFQELITGSPNNYIKYIVETAINSLNKTYLEKDLGTGQYKGHAAGTLAYWPVGDNVMQSISVPTLLAIIKKYFIQRVASVNEKKELLVTLYNKNPDLVNDNIDKIVKILGRDDITSTILSNRSKFYKNLESLPENMVDVLFKTVSDNDINYAFQLEQLFKLCTAICSAEISYGRTPSCLPGFIGRIAFCIVDELEPSMSDKYELWIGGATPSNNLVINKNNIREVVNSLVSKIIVEFKEDNELMIQFQDFIYESSGPDCARIPVQYNIIYQCINKVFLDTYNRIPAYEEYELLLNSLGESHKLQHSLIPNIFSKDFNELISPLLDATYQNLIYKTVNKLKNNELKFFGKVYKEKIKDLYNKIFNGDYVKGYSITEEMLNQCNDILLKVIAALRITDFDNNDSIEKISPRFKEALLAAPNIDLLIRTNLIINNETLQQQYLRDLSLNENESDISLLYNALIVEESFNNMAPLL